MDEYFLISVSEDGDVSVSSWDSREKLLKDLEHDELNVADFAEKIEDCDPQYWGNHPYLLIKGHIVVPKPKQVTVSLDVE